MNSKALEALYVAAKAIAKIPGVKTATADNDNDSGEVIFILTTGEEYVLNLKQVEARSSPKSKLVETDKTDFDPDPIT